MLVNGAKNGVIPAPFYIVFLYVFFITKNKISPSSSPTDLI